MPLETLRPHTSQDLTDDLNALSRRVVQANFGDPEAALDLAREFEVWAQRAQKTSGEWSNTCHEMAQGLVKELKEGLAPAKAMEKLLRTLLQIHRLLENEQRGEAENDSRSLSPPAQGRFDENPRKGDELYIRPEDQGLFQLFLHEAPTFLSGIQSNLLLLISKQKADVQQIFRLFHVLAGQWSFLGFLQMRQVCQAVQTLLEPLLSGAQEPSGAHLDGLLKALGACRSQVNRIARGLAKEHVEVWDATPILQELLEQMAPQVPEAVPSRGELENQMARSLEGGHTPEDPAWTMPPPLGSEEPLRLQDEFLEGLLSLLGDLMFSQAGFLEETLAQNLKGRSATEAARITKLTRQLRDQLLSLCMVPLKPLFERLAWNLARISRQAGKRVSLTLEGTDIEVDKQLLPQLAGPLSQLLQNAVEHGIEAEAERVRAGKTPEGAVRVKATLQAGSVVLEVEDDGHGLDLEKIRKKIRELGLLTDEKTPPSRLMEMIFKPGVTTLKDLGEEHGQGLDQVESQVENLFGSIHVQSKAGQGCKFTLKVPRTQALIEGWVVEAAGKLYLLPLSQVRKITHPVPAGSEKENLPEDAAAPIVDLGRWMKEPGGGDTSKFSVHVEAGSSRFQLQVDEVHGKQQVLVWKKSRETNPKPGLCGEALLPDGKVVWVLDTRQLGQT